MSITFGAFAWLHAVRAFLFIEFCSAVVKIVVSIAEFRLILDPASCSCRLALSDSVDLFPPFVIIEQQLALSGVWFGGFDAD